MKAIQVAQTGDSSQLHYKDLENPKPGENEVLLENKAIGINFIDIYHRTGLYPKELPFIPGLEGAGIVKEVGSAVDNLQQGDRIAYVGVPNAYAEFVCVPYDKCVIIPDNIATETAAAIMLQGMTAHYLSKSTYPLAEGDTCLIHAAAGGVGLLLVQMAKMAGARIIGTVSTREKAELAIKAGADEIILYTQRDFEEETKRLTEGKGVNVVYDSVGIDTFEKSLNVLSTLGYMVLYGQSSGPVSSFDPAELNKKGSLFLTRPTLFHYVATRKQLQQRADDLFTWLSEGKLNVRIDQALYLSEAKKAHDLLEQRKTSGKLLLIP